MLDKVFFHNGVPVTGRQIMDDLQMHRIPDWAIAAFTKSLVPFYSEDQPRGEHGRWSPGGGGGGGGGAAVAAPGGDAGGDAANRAAHAARHAKGEVSGEYMADVDYTKPMGKDGAIKGGAESPPPKKAAEQDTSQGITAPGGTTDAPRKAYETSDQQKQLQGELNAMHKDLSAKYEGKGDAAALAVATEGAKVAESEIGPRADLKRLRAWAGQKIDSAMTEATDWVRAVAGDPKKAITNAHEGFGDAMKNFAAHAVRIATNPLIELPKLMLNLAMPGTREGFADHDAKRLKDTWGEKTANLVIASGSALASGVAAAGLIAGLAGGGIGVAAAAGGAAALLHYCPGFRAWVSRFPANLLLNAMNKYGLADTTSEAALRKGAREDRARQAPKDEFEKKAKAAGFNDWAWFADDKEVPSPEKIRSIAKDFYAGIQKKLWEEVILKNKKFMGMLKALGEMHHADPKMVKKTFDAINKAYPMKGSANFGGWDRVVLDGKLIPRSEARRQLRKAGLKKSAIALFLA